MQGAGLRVVNLRLEAQVFLAQLPRLFLERRETKSGLKFDRFLGGQKRDLSLPATKSDITSRRVGLVDLVSTLRTFFEEKRAPSWGAEHCAISNIKTIS